MKNILKNYTTTDNNNNSDSIPRYRKNKSDKSDLVLTNNSNLETLATNWCHFCQAMNNKSRAVAYCNNRTIYKCITCNKLLGN